MAPTPAKVLQGVRVLVVDDEVDAREALVGLLERYGAQARPAGSVAEAMSVLGEDATDVLVTDLGMPVEDGYELIRRVRLRGGAGAGLPSLAVSAYATDSHRRRVAEAGFHGHLEKPVTPAELVAAVARLAGRRDAAPSRWTD